MEGMFFLFYAHVLGVMYILYRILTLGGVDYFSVKSLKMMTVLYFFFSYTITVLLSHSWRAYESNDSISYWKICMRLRSEGCIKDTVIHFLFLISSLFRIQFMHTYICWVIFQQIMQNVGLIKKASFKTYIVSYYQPIFVHLKQMFS